MEGSTIAPSVKHHSVELEDCGSVNVFIRVTTLVDVFQYLAAHPPQIFRVGVGVFENIEIFDKNSSCNSTIPPL